MKSKLLSLLLILSLLLPAAWAEPLEIEPAPAEAAVPEIAEPLAPDVFPNDAAVPLKVTYTGPALSKPYDKTTDVSNALGAWLLDKQPLRSDFALSGVEAGYESVRVTQYSVGKFAKPDVGSYSLTVTVTLAGDDAAHYTAGTAAIPAAITKRPVTVTPIPGLSKLYGADDPAQGCAGSIYRIPEDPAFSHCCPIEGGVLGEACQALLDAFFAARRSAPANASILD